MPTSAVSAAILPRISPAMARTSSSGSGSDMVAAFRLVEVALQDDRGGERFDVGLARPARARLAQLGLRGGGGERLVPHPPRHLVARGEPARELLRELRHGVLRAVGVVRLADHEGDRMPFGHQAVDVRESLLVRLRLDRAERVGDARGGLAHREPDALGAEVESDERAGYGFGAGDHACPASSERLAAFTPTACIAAW